MSSNIVVTLADQPVSSAGVTHPIARSDVHIHSPFEVCDTDSLNIPCDLRLSGADEMNRFGGNLDERRTPHT